MCSTSASAADVLRVGLREEVHGLLAGPDGGAYAQVERPGGKTDVARVLPDGRTVLARGFPLLDGGALGPDGSAWYGGDRRSRLVRVDPAGTAHTVAVPEPGLLAPLASAPDGTLWGPSEEAETLTRLGPDGRLEQTASGHDPCSPRGLDRPPLVRAADGALWLADECRVLTRDGVVVELPGGADALAADPTGGVWVLQGDGYPYEVVHVTADGRLLATTLPRGSASDIAAAPDGSVWVAFRRCTVTRVGADGQVTNVPAPLAAKELAFDGTGQLWLANRARLARGLDGTCDGSAPRVRVPRRTSLAALRRGIPVTVSGRAHVTAYTTADVKEPAFSATPTTRTLPRAGRFRARVAYSERRQIERSPTTVRVVVSVTDDEGNEEGHEFRVRVTR
ncbi:virginiamycin B lyase family protein [Solirubrobacter pauli]|nr:hypothetical protein [Solirubrobacter pauli]